MTACNQWFLPVNRSLLAHFLRFGYDRDNKDKGVLQRGKFHFLLQVPLFVSRDC